MNSWTSSGVEKIICSSSSSWYLNSFMDSLAFCLRCRSDSTNFPCKIAVVLVVLDESDSGGDVCFLGEVAEVPDEMEPGNLLEVELARGKERRVVIEKNELDSVAQPALGAGAFIAERSIVSRRRLAGVAKRPQRRVRARGPRFKARKDERCVRLTGVIEPQWAHGCVRPVRSD
ncbi:hypothetical protein BKA80DRAFT_284843 [Phyllosticta citrichinensis]